MKRKILIVLFIICLAINCYAADLCITSTGSGSFSGVDWNNALKWNSGANQCSFIRGNSYFFSDGTYENRSLSTSESGSTYIYFKKAILTDHITETGWSSAMGDGQADFTTAASGVNVLTFTTGYWSVDGQGGGGSTGSWDSGHGFKISCTNTSTGSNALILLSGTPDYFAFDQIELSHSGTQLGRGVSKDGIYAVYAGAAGTGVTYVTIKDCYFHDANRTFMITRGTANWTIEYCLFKEVCSSTISESTPYQSEAWSAKGDSDHIIRYNKFVDITGSGVLYIKNDNNEKTERWEIYGNLFYRNDGFEQGFLSGGIVGSDSQGIYTNFEVNDFEIYNNTIYFYKHYTGSTGASNSGIDIDCEVTSGNLVYNNIWYDTHLSSTESSAFDGVDIHNWNWFYETYQYNGGGSNSSAWASSETNGELGTSDPFVNSASYDLKLSAATDTGTDTGAAIPENDSDPVNNTRGEDGVWDRGAYEYDSGSSTTTIQGVTIQ